MQITGLTLDQFTEVTTRVSATFYGGNVTVAQDASDRTVKTARCTARLRVTDSRGEGARRSASGRHGPYACWHAYRDVLTALFTSYPEARVRTLLTDYRGRQSFEDLYPATGRQNIGSQAVPETMPELCECNGNVPPDARTQRERMSAYAHRGPARRALSPDASDTPMFVT